MERSNFPPQRWGILPTRAFWERPRFWRSVSMFMIPLVMIETRLLVEAAIRYDGWWRLLGMAGMLVVMVLSYGGIERYIRSPARNVSDDERYQLLAPPREDESTYQRRNLRITRVGLALMAMTMVGLSIWQAMTLHR